MSAMTCTADRLIDDARTRETRFTFAPEQQTGWLRHGFDYVITALTDCHMRLEHPDGTSTETTVPAGAAYRRDAGGEHNVINAGGAETSFIEVELK